MAGYDPNRPRPTDSDPFVGLPGDPQSNRSDTESEPPVVKEPELAVAGALEDETEPTLQTVPQAVPPLDRRIPLMAVLGGLCGFTLVVLILRRITKRNR
ncbi:MAG: hypothetical protein VX410_04355 [Actinomycetota bacterium]|nr:hypothetical protein [Actinomycetota bacterium]